MISDQLFFDSQEEADENAKQREKKLGKSFISRFSPSTGRYVSESQEYADWIAEQHRGKHFVPSTDYDGRDDR